MKTTLSTIKSQIAIHLQSLIDKKQETVISWKCTYCQEEHSGNLLKKVGNISASHTIEDYKPDLAFFDLQGNLFAVIHFLKKKSMDAVLSNFYHGKCIYIQIKLEVGSDFYSLLEKIQKPKFVTVCFNPKCQTCYNYMQKTYIWIVKSKCYRCHQPIMVSSIEAGMSRGGTCEGPDKFSEEELSIARSNGVVIAMQYSKTRSKSYLANTCPNCNTFVGKHYLFKDHISLAGYGYYTYEKFEVGHYCESCTAPKMVIEQYE